MNWFLCFELSISFPHHVKRSRNVGPQFEESLVCHWHNNLMNNAIVALRNPVDNILVNIKPVSIY